VHSVAFEIVPFHDEHIDAAAALSVAGYRLLLAAEPALPPEWLDLDGRREGIAAAARSGPGVAALVRGQLAGFLIGTMDLGGQMPRAGWSSDATLGGGRSAHIRIGHHGAAEEDRAPIYREMHGAMARRFIARGCFRHSITVAVSDAEAVQAWFTLGFGIDQILGTRDTAALAPPSAEFAVRRAIPDDVDDLLSLSLDLLRFHAASPIFFPFYFSAGPVRRNFLAAFDAPGKAVWLATRDGQCLGVMEFDGGGRPSLNNARSANAITIGMASTASASRLSGVGTAILARSLDWAQDEGYDRCTVGWTAANLISHPFWLGRGFRAVHYTLTRQLDERIAWAGEGQADEDLLREW
jgi:GNAT superfamily N-acetyltransferase